MLTMFFGLAHNGFQSFNEGTKVNNPRCYACRYVRIYTVSSSAYAENCMSLRGSIRNFS